MCAGWHLFGTNLIYLFLFASGYTDLFSWSARKQRAPRVPRAHNAVARALVGAKIRISENQLRPVKNLRMPRCSICFIQRHSVYKHSCNIYKISLSSLQSKGSFHQTMQPNTLAPCKVWSWVMPTCRHDSNAQTRMQRKDRRNVFHHGCWMMSKVRRRLGLHQVHQSPSIILCLEFVLCSWQGTDARLCTDIAAKEKPRKRQSSCRLF